MVHWLFLWVLVFECYSLGCEDTKSLKSARGSLTICSIDLCLSFLLIMFIWCSLAGRACAGESKPRSRGVLLSACQLFTLHHLPQATGLFLPCSLLGSKQIYSEGGKKRREQRVCSKRRGMGRGWGGDPHWCKITGYLFLLPWGPKATCLLPRLLQPLCTAPAKNH